MSEVFHPFFRLSGEFDPDEVTRMLGIQPSAVSRIGDPGPPGALGARSGAEWVWQPQNDDSDHLGDQLAYLIGSLTPKSKVVAELSQKFWGTFHVCNQFNREWFVPAEALRSLADLRVHIQCEEIRPAAIEETRTNAN